MSDFYSTIIDLEFVGDCTDMSVRRMEVLMDGQKRANYVKVVSLIKKHVSHMYEILALKYPNPYYCYRTDTHIIFKHSGIEYFFKIRRME